MTSENLSEITFVLVHGAWHGGWCWKHVAEKLKHHGHRVTTPTLSGLGERRGVGVGDIDFETHVSDIVQHIELEDLERVVLVGHSYGGAVITHVADRIPTLLDRLIYLDAQISSSGHSLMDGLDPETRDERRAALDQEGLCMLSPAPEFFGVTDAQQAEWVRSRLTPHPIATYEQRCHLQHPVGAGLPCAFVRCTKPTFPAMGVFAKKAQELGWPMHELATGHDAMLTAPAETARLLMYLADADNPQPADERDAILEPIGLYIEGWQGRADKFANAFDPDAWIFYTDANGIQHQGLLTEMFADWAATGWDIDGQIISVTQSGEVASVLLEFINKSSPAASFTDVHTLLKVNGQWKITNKTAAHKS